MLHFVDLSLAVAALRAGPERLLADIGYLGLLFESLVVVTAFGYAYDRPDGVAVVPVTTLGP